MKIQTLKNRLSNGADLKYQGKRVAQVLYKSATETQILARIEGKTEFILISLGALYF